MTHKKKDDLIKRSHRRSEDFGVEKNRITSKKIIGNQQLNAILNQGNELIEISKPFIDHVYQILEDTGFIIVLTDAEGCILYIKGKEETLIAAKDLNMIPGAYMDEKSIGTNAMGTAINENAPVQITATEHFISAYHKWTCSAAPIHDAQNQIIGTLNLTADKSKAHPHTLGLVISTVHAIENYRNNLEIQKQLVSSQQYAFTLMNHLSFGVFAVDDNDKIIWVNDTACRVINIKRSILVNKLITDIFPSWFLTKKHLNNQKEYLNQEDRFGLDELTDRFLFNAYKISFDSIKGFGYLITFHSKKQFINLANNITKDQSKYSFDDIITQNARMLQIIHYAKVVSKNPSTILITGESGTGKEVFAQSIHENSDRRNNNFVAINCGAIPDELIESELFGYEAGAFTGAKKEGKTGKFEIANGGTIFLDEIGDMPLKMQVKLLRAIQENYITKVGGNKQIPIDVRILTATNKNLEEEIKKDNFRLDLYYRINVIEIKIPALRERPEDILPLFRYFLRTRAEKLNKTIPDLQDSIQKQIKQYHWPGNIRELENFAEKTIILNGKLENLLPINAKIDTEQQMIEEPKKLRKLHEIEKEHILGTLKSLDWNISKAAHSLDIGRNTLYQKMKKYQISQ